MSLSVILKSIGIFTAVSSTYSLLHFLTPYITPSKIQRYHSGNSPYALITGSSDGIGLALARELASHGFNIVLHGRNAAKLAAKKRELQTDFPNVLVRVLVADAVQVCKEAGDGVDGLVRQLEGLNLRILINNIGGVSSVMFPTSQTLAATTATEIDGLIDVNARFATQLTRAVWPLLTSDSSPTKPSLILNIGSLAQLGAPYTSVYAGAKAFNMAWSRSLMLEAQSEGLHGVEVLGILVGSVTGVTHRKTEPSWTVPSAETMARAALARVGCGRAILVGYFPHALQIAVFGALPEWVGASVISSVMKKLREEQLREVKGR